MTFIPRTSRAMSDPRIEFILFIYFTASNHNHPIFFALETTYIQLYLEIQLTCADETINFNNHT